MGKSIIVKGAREHNLKNITIEIPRDKLVVITGLSGSGKSSVAFDTIYAEGQRRYVESLSAYARQFLEQMRKPDVDSIEGLSPAISIEQKGISKNPRSTVATVTEIYDYLRLLFARVGHPHCYECGKPISSQSVQQMVDQIMDLPGQSRIMILSPVVRGKKGEFHKELNRLRKEGFVRLRIDGELHDLTDEITLNKNQRHHIEVVVDRLVLKENITRRLADSLEVALALSNGIVKIEDLSGDEWLFSEKFACIDCGISYPEITPRIFSFNSPYGACPTCGGLGTRLYFDPDLVVPDHTVSIHEGAIHPWARRNTPYYHQMLDALSQHYGFDLDTSFKDLSPKIQQVLLYGSDNEKIRFYYEEDDRRHFFHRPYEGVIPNLERRYKETESQTSREDLERYVNLRPCPECNESRLRRESLFVKIKDRSIYEITCFSVTEALNFFSDLGLTEREKTIAQPILKEVRARLQFMTDMGLDYLTLNRASGTLSGGEGQRIRLATQIGSGLMGVLYILDEPSIGLHARDLDKLVSNLKRLRDLGNTVLVVEHDEATILAADYVIDMGPGAGAHGGKVVFSGTPEQLLQHEASLTGQYVSGRRTVSVPIRRRRPGGRFLAVRGACENNLKQVDVRFPLGLLICVTGVSGSGKSTLVIDTLYRALAQQIYRSKEKPGAFERLEGTVYIDKVIDIDQSPIGRTPRSNPATYTGVFTAIRELFAATSEAKVRGYRAGRFSFNVKGGRCEACSGDGIIKIEMHFLPDVYVPCEVCKGRRYDRETLEVYYKGKNVADVLDMTVVEALDFFTHIPRIREKLQTLHDVGLGYITLGQPATTLSGGEAQRIKLSRELSKRSTGRTLYLLDEPTTGLHFADVQKLLDVLSRLTDMGNTTVIIEHNLEVIKTADWIIDLGPEGGDEGGYVVATGTPEAVSEHPESYTGRYLRHVLDREVIRDRGLGVRDS